MTNLRLVGISAFLFEEEKCLPSTSGPPVLLGDAVECAFGMLDVIFLKYDRSLHLLESF